MPGVGIIQGKSIRISQCVRWSCAELASRQPAPQAVTASPTPAVHGGIRPFRRRRPRSSASRKPSRDPGTPFNSLHINLTSEERLGGGHFQPGTARLTIGL